MYKSANASKKNFDQQITDDQSCSYEINGDRKKWAEKKYNFFGRHWHDFAIFLAQSGFDLHMLNYFIGARLFWDQKKIIMSNMFGKEVWMDRYAARLKGWLIEVAPKRTRLRSYSEDDDTLIYKLDGVDAEDIWAEYFEPLIGGRPQDENYPLAPAKGS